MKYSENLPHYFEKHYIPYLNKTTIPSNLCTYLMEYEDGDERNFVRAVCHADAYPCRHGRPKHVHACIFDSDIETKDYVEWICGPQSPWRRLFSPNSIYRDAMGYIRGVSLFNINEQPFKLYMNFLFASRVHSEHRDNHRWLTYVEARNRGLSHAKAFVIGHMFEHKNDSLYQAIDTNGWHAPLTHLHNANPISIKRLENADPLDVAKLTKNYYNGYFGNVNTIWNDNKSLPKVPYFVMKDLEMNKMVYTGNFNRSFDKVKKVEAAAEMFQEGKGLSWNTLIQKQEDWYS